MKKQLKAIFENFKSKPSRYKFLDNQIKRVHEIIPSDFGGGCSYQKGLLMSLLISEMDLKVSADIGVYRGRSLFPQAIAHKSFTKGLVYGIDPYSNTAAVQNDRPDLKEALDAFVESTDFNQLYAFVNNLIQKERLEDSCKLIRKKSVDAAIDFKKDSILFDLVHIDGNHDTSSVLNDVEFYSPLLKSKAFIVLDDISWESVKPAYDILSDKMNLIDELVDESNDFALFSIGLDEDEIVRVQKIFKFLI